MADFDHGRLVSLQGSPYTQSFTIALGVLETDGIINLPKLKTHNLTRMTGAVKNLYGCIPGALKKALHMLNPTAQAFSRMLVSLSLLLRPRLHIMDGIVAMEGNGPAGGDPRPMGVLLFSTDPVALDALMCRLVELDPLYMPSARPGRAWGLGTYVPEEIDLLGDDWLQAADGDFRVSRGSVLDLSGPGMLTYMNNLIGRRPVIDHSTCTRCGRCVEACPLDPKAVGWRDGNKERAPAYSYLRCIRCYCCQEACLQGAISVRSTILRL
jgi:Pyruvate/2-oxoacid:ferredoxin oxidoreductase delta subunit